ncbi:hypothetical protein [Butyricicoccus sp. Marseille-Q5471]|uniref:hypothetical protein n=1 Tax=Butyricicoccus sp. Marseille-Q5471 TaxID=3039493 RepID=UPI0024BC5E83|nr:hypothetical protein [Butyricicoccus sp. Marseille-Q5471]
MNEVHLCLSDLLDQDLTAFEYFQTLAPSVQTELQNSEIATFEELQVCANQIKSKKKR